MSGSTSSVGDDFVTVNGTEYDVAAGAAVLEPHWRRLDGQHHKAALYLAGAMLQGRRAPVEVVLVLVERLCTLVGDKSVKDRLRDVRDTKKKVDAEEPARGWPALAKLLGEGGDDLLDKALLAAGVFEDIYPYPDANGRVVMEVVRLRPKSFRQRHRDKDGKPVWNLDGVQGVLFRLPELLAARAKDPDELILFCEGEKDARRAAAAGFVTTCTPMGAQGENKFDPRSYLEPLRGATVCMLPHNDDTGRAYMRRVAARLLGVGARVRVLHLRDVWPFTGAKGDVADYLLAGGTKEELLGWIEAAPPFVAQKNDEDDTAADWPDPVPLGEVPEALPFPLDVFPAALRRFVEEAAPTFPCPPDYLAVPLVVMAAAALGASRAVMVKHGHVQVGILYAVVVGPPGSAKTPAQNMVIADTRQIEARVVAAWKAAMKRYKEAVETYEADLKKWKADRKGEQPQKPERPILLRFTVGDVTVEALAPILDENPRGVVRVQDELMAWVLGMNAYREGGKGADQQFWLSGWSYSGGPVDRRKTHADGPLLPAHPFVCVVGGLVPDNLHALRGDRPGQRGNNDGFIDRILMTYPKEVPDEGENFLEVSPATLGAMNAVLCKLRTLQMVPVQGEAEEVVQYRPFLVRLTADGKKEWQRFTQEHAAEKNAPDFPPHLLGPWAKFKAYCARLALVLHYCRWAAGELEKPDDGVDGESMRRAATLIVYFKSHAQKCYAIMDADPQVSAARKILQWALSQDLQRFSKRDAHQALRGAFQTVADVQPALDTLVEHGLIRPEPLPDRQGRGRKPSPGYEISPHIRTQNTQNTQNSRPRANSEYSEYSEYASEEKNASDPIAPPSREVDAHTLTGETPLIRKGSSESSELAGSCPDGVVEVEPGVWEGTI
jgi:hypothetical protein